MISWIQGKTKKTYNGKSYTAAADSHHTIYSISSNFQLSFPLIILPITRKMCTSKNYVGRIFYIFHINKTSWRNDRHETQK